jgi:DNA-binding transcriptional regulator YiaG
MKKKKETFIYEGLGFPIELIDAPMKKVYGEWVIDINMSALQRFVFRGLIHKPYPLSGKEVRFLRKFLKISTTDLGKKLGISHATIVKWEKGQVQISPVQETYIRMFFCEFFKDQEILKLYKEIRPEMLAELKNERQHPFQVHTREIETANF